METQPSSDSNKKTPPQTVPVGTVPGGDNKVASLDEKRDEKKTYLTPWQINNVVAIMNSNTKTGSAFKDLRLLQNLRKKIKKCSAKKPEQLPLYKDPKNPTDEEKKAAPELTKEWKEVFQVYSDTEVPFDFKPIEKSFIAGKLRHFQGYPEDELNSEKFLALGEKFGIKE